MGSIKGSAAACRPLFLCLVFSLFPAVYYESEEEEVAQAGLRLTFFSMPGPYLDRRKRRDIFGIWKDRAS